MSRRAQRWVLLAMSTTSGACVERIDAVDRDVVPNEVQRRLDMHCAISGCHVAGATEPDLTRSSSGRILQEQASQAPLLYVERGDVMRSYLALKILGDPSIVGARMPSGGRTMPPEDAAVIVGWIAGVNFADEDSVASDGSTSSENDDPEIDGPVSYAAQIQPIWDAKCSGNGCHIGEQTFAPDLSAQRSYENLVMANTTSGSGVRVVAGEPDRSVLLHRLRGEPSYMPQGASEPIPEVPLVERWIIEGALQVPSME